jgi:hypothetical protein
MNGRHCISIFTPFYTGGLGIVVLKVPKREIFVTELFTLSDPIWVCDLRTEPKKPFL